MAAADITDRDWDDLDAAKHLFYFVREFVATKSPAMGKVSLGGFCEEIYNLRKLHGAGLAGRRAFMHVGHAARIICAWLPAVRLLPIENQVGLWIHEFGHLGSGGGDDAADLWAKKRLGVSICYTGPLALEWVGPDAVRKVLAMRPRMPTRRRRR